MVSEAGFRIARAVRNRSMASRISESWIVSDEDLLYRPRNLPSADLYPYLDRGCFLSDRIHLTEEGKQRAAEHIAEFLRTEKLLPVK
jgi:lysophospholipase L1-like esterase